MYAFIWSYRERNNTPGVNLTISYDLRQPEDCLTLSNPFTQNQIKNVILLDYSIFDTITLNQLFRMLVHTDCYRIRYQAGGWE